MKGEWEKWKIDGLAWVALGALWRLVKRLVVRAVYGRAVAHDMRVAEALERGNRKLAELDAKAAWNEDDEEDEDEDEDEDDEAHWKGDVHDLNGAILRLRDRIVARDGKDPKVAAAIAINWFNDKFDNVHIKHLRGNRFEAKIW